MTIYAIGDIQGCFKQFEALLTLLNFDDAMDNLWFTGDLVNRGPDSLEVLRFVKNLKGKHLVVLGNHDLHLLAVAYGARAQHRNDTLDAILTAPDREEILFWLRQQKLAHYDAERNYFLSHAGLAPMWGAKEAVSYAQEVETALQSEDIKDFLFGMYGNQPALWSNELTGIERLRCITNYLTRMRFCHADGSLDLEYKGTIEKKPANLIPWFAMPNRKDAKIDIVFGHWAALGGKADVPNIYPLDTGCVWGNSLTALRLPDKKHFSVTCC